MIVLPCTNNSLLATPVPSTQRPLYISSVLHFHYYAKRRAFIFEEFRKFGTKSSVDCVNVWDPPENGRVGNRAQLTVPLWLYVPRNFSSNTELGIRSTCLVRRNRNKERPYELLIVMALPPAAQHPFKIQILFKFNRLCWALSCGSLSTAALWEKESNGCSRKRNQLEAPWCSSPSPSANMLLSRESLSYVFWEDSNLYPPNVRQELSMWGPPQLSFLPMVVHPWIVTFPHFWSATTHK